MAGADVGDLEVEYVTDALRNGWYEDKYYYVEKLESEFSKYHNRSYALMTPNCTSAIHLILASLGVGNGDEVIMPECTWIASSVSTVHLGAKPIFCDIEKDSWCLDPASVRKNITNKTKAIIVVDLFGNMANWEELEKISQEYNIPLIEDAAEALGSTLRGVKAGKFGIGSAFSFHNTKTITTGEGGMLLLDDKCLYEKCVKLRDLGRGPSTKPYLNEVVGYKWMPFNMQAALGLAQFDRLNDLLAIKRMHFDFYRSELCGIDKNVFIEKLNDLGCPSRPFFYPLSSIPAYNQSEKYKNKNINSYSISSRGINLPGAYNLRIEDLDFICKSIKKILK